MTTINLRDFYPWYAHDEYIEVPDKVAKELLAGKRYEKIHRQRMKRNRSQYSLDAGDGIEAAACFAALSPHEIVERQERRCRLCRALNSLSEKQGHRVEAHYILGMSMTDIAKAEGVVKSSICESIDRGIQNMKKYLENNL